MAVQYIKNNEEFNKIIKENKLVVIDFTATWCGPCKQVGPLFEKLHADNVFPNVTFWKIDVDENEETPESCEISAMPTFQFFKDGKKADEVVGASIEKVKEMIQKHNN